MWTNIERGIDGAVGRMLSWLTQPPVRASHFEEEAAEPVDVSDRSDVSDVPDIPAEESEGLETEILGALADASTGLAMKELVQQTGEKRYALRQRLNRMIAEGTIQRRGEGMRTRYHPTET